VIYLFIYLFIYFRGEFSPFCEKIILEKMTYSVTKLFLIRLKNNNLFLKIS